jgi:hypothetical protein
MALPLKFVPVKTKGLAVKNIQQKPRAQLVKDKII